MSPRRLRWRCFSGSPLALTKSRTCVNFDFSFVIVGHCSRNKQESQVLLNETTLISITHPTEMEDREERVVAKDAYLKTAAG